MKGLRALIAVLGISVIFISGCIGGDGKWSIRTTQIQINPVVDEWTFLDNPGIELLLKNDSGSEGKYEVQIILPKYVEIKESSVGDANVTYNNTEGDTNITKVTGKLEHGKEQYFTFQIKVGKKEDFTETFKLYVDGKGVTTISTHTIEPKAV